MNVTLLATLKHIKHIYTKITNMAGKRNRQTNKYTQTRRIQESLTHTRQSKNPKRKQNASKT